MSPEGVSVEKGLLYKLMWVWVVIFKAFRWFLKQWTYTMTVHSFLKSHHSEVSRYGTIAQY